jgi:sarcosine oxidase subunit beta
MPDIAIIGGGISGVSAAYELARRGKSVVLFEARAIGAMASTWTLGGVRQSGRDPAELPLAIAAVERWSQLDAELGAPTGYRRKGNLRLARNPSEVEVLRAMVARQRELGLDLDLLEDRSAIGSIAPALGEAVLAASFCPRDGHADPDLAMAAYATAARRHGAVLRVGEPVLRIVERGGQVVGVETAAGLTGAERVILASGVHAPGLLAPLGLRLPMRPMRVSVLQTVPTAPVFEQVFGVANADCAGRQEIDGRFRITTGIDAWPGEVESWREADLRPPLGSVAALIDRVTPLLPVIAALGLERVWGGLIDLTPDGLPVIDAPASHAGLIVGAGFSGHGFGIGPVVGDCLAALALGERPAFDLAPFRLDRFGADAFLPLALHG